MVFLYNYITKESITYLMLLKKVESLDSVNSVIDERDPAKFYIKLLANVIHNLDSVVVDTDLSIDAGKDVLDVKQNVKPIIKNKGVFKSWNVFLESFINSKSKITIFTSGTTGKPKKVVHTVSKFVEMSRIGNKYEGNKWAFLYNPSHMAGFQVFFQSFLNKNTLVYLFQSTRDKFIEAVVDQHITHVSATPTFYRLLSPYNFELNSIKNCTLGGEKCDYQLIDNLKIVFPKANIHNIYASTEAGSLFVSKGETFKVIEKLRDKIQFIENEIVIHNSLLGEFGNEDWFYTGDMVEFIKGSSVEFKIISRKNDTINIGGNRVNLLEVEKEILQLKGVVNAKVFAVDNSVLGKIISCEVISSVEYTKKEFKNKLKESLQLYKIPTKVQFVEELQTTRTGKLKRS